MSQRRTKKAGSDYRRAEVDEPATYVRGSVCDRWELSLCVGAACEGQNGLSTRDLVMVTRSALASDHQHRKDQQTQIQGQGGP